MMDRNTKRPEEWETVLLIISACMVRGLKRVSLTQCGDKEHAPIRQGTFFRLSVRGWLKRLKEASK